MWNQLKYFWSKTNRWYRVLLFFFIAELPFIPGGQVGFQCNDPALSYTYCGDTINFKILFVVTIILPLTTVLLVERLEGNKDNKQLALIWYIEYVYGAFLNATIVQLLKLIVGSPRPHFFDTCRPKEALTCQGSEYVPSYTCTQTGYVTQSAKSFPSGHTSLAVHCGVFVAYYLHQRISKKNRWIRSVQIASVLSAILCALSRVADRRHHWWDVLGGAAIAAPLLIYTIFHLCKNFKCHVENKERIEDSGREQNKSSVSL